MSKYLIVIDMQNDFISGSLGSETAEAIVPKVREKIAKYIENNDFVIFTRDTHFDNYFSTLEGKNLPISHCKFRTNGWNIEKSLLSLFPSGCSIIDKITFGYDGWEKLFADRKVDEIEIVGLCTDICVVSNALLLRTALPNTPIICDSSCCAGTSVDAHNAALKVMKSCQIKIS